MAKLHELLAVETNLRGQAESCRADLRNTFEKKQQHFKEAVVTFHSKEEGVPPKVEGQLQLQTTVKKELSWISQKIAAALDASYQIDVANTVAKADVVLDDGTTLLSDVPATQLLQLEKRLKEVQELAHAIPTLDPAKGFAPDPDRGDGIWRARHDERVRTAKKFDFVVMVKPTDKFPAQVKELMLDVEVGQIVQQEWSSLITVSEKAEILDRLEEVLRAVKKARARANEIDIDVRAHKIGHRLLRHIFGV